MIKGNDPLVQFAALRRALASEGDALRKRLQQIDSVLAGTEDIPTASADRTTRRLPKSKRPRNKLSLREAVARVTASKPLALVEVVTAVQKLGYRFASRNPQNSAGAFLYGHGKKYFKRANGKFSPK